MREIVEEERGLDEALGVRARRLRGVPLTRIASRIANAIRGNPTSPRGGEEGAGADLFSPRGEGGREAAG
ncbi:hypothetical protein MPL3356_310104 [Mesorhizobium plurifarium]|uniref:Uncharacterized protein n=1 Tax=Mesorhizobium plurifarium TaxID=69974 RepID=A0A090DTW6_MESPL|nr:hypothetical protein MPL3356_310104 [Mesorhizobium plurifarium]